MKKGSVVSVPGRCRPCARVEVLEAGAKQAWKDPSAVKPCDPGRQAEIEVEFTTPDSLFEHRNRCGAEQVVGHTLVARRDDWRTV